MPEQPLARAGVKNDAQPLYNKLSLPLSLFGQGWLYLGRLKASCVDVAGKRYTGTFRH